METVYIGVDIGGTKTEVAIYDAACWQRRASRVFNTEPSRGCRTLVEDIYNNCRHMLRTDSIPIASVAAVGVASPGPLDLKTGRIVHIPTMGFRDEPLVDWLQQGFGRPICLENDANCAAYAESRFGRGRGKRVVVYITVSTGIGCGLVVDGRIVDGAHWAAGELGHLTVERQGEPCPCGKKGCLERYASGTAIARRASMRTGTAMEAKEVFAAARTGDTLCLTVIREAAEALGMAVAAVYQLLDPDVVILGGSVMKDADLLGPLLQESLAACVQPLEGRRLDVVLSGLDGQQVVLGAAAYAAANLKMKP